MKNLKNNVLFKVLAIVVLIIILLIPTFMVQDLIHERERFQKDAINEVSSKWGEGQTIIGPYISVPYEVVTTKYSKKDSTDIEYTRTEWVHFLPEQLNIKGDITPEKRYRGIYEIVVYESKLKIEGSFNYLNFLDNDYKNSGLEFDRAVLNIGIDDLKGIEKQIPIKWNNKVYDFNSGTSDYDLADEGISVNIPISLTDSTDYAFSLDLDLKGSQYLYFVPLGKTSNVGIRSNWQTPSFTGEFLPDNRNVTESGFTADWNVLHLNRNYPQTFKGEKDLDESSFGTDLLLPVDNYKKSLRVAKYAILTIVLTFMVFFFVEVLSKSFIHPVQYLLVGVALILFYTLLLSFSEYMIFNFAYLLAAVLTLFLITAYMMAILKSKKLSGFIFGILTIIYVFIFVIIQLEDYALLVGSIGVFLILGVVMYTSRKIDWYDLKLGGNGEE